VGVEEEDVQAVAELRRGGEIVRRAEVLAALNPVEEGECVVEAQLDGLSEEEASPEREGDAEVLLVRVAASTLCVTLLVSQGL